MALEQQHSESNRVAFWMAFQKKSDDFQAEVAAFEGDKEAKGRPLCCVAAGRRGTAPPPRPQPTQQNPGSGHPVFSQASPYTWLFDAPRRPQYTSGEGVQPANGLTRTAPRGRARQGTDPNSPCATPHPQGRGRFVCTALLPTTQLA